MTPFGSDLGLSLHILSLSSEVWKTLRVPADCKAPFSDPPNESQDGEKAQAVKQPRSVPVGPGRSTIRWPAKSRTGQAASHGAARPKEYKNNATGFRTIEHNSI